jgi:hypothetical protein
MEQYQQKQGDVLSLKREPANQWETDPQSLEECRSLVSLLNKKTETLYRECRNDREKTTHIRTLGSILAAITSLVKRLENDSRIVNRPDVFEDALGYTYHSVRSCDLDRLCDK